MDLKIIKYVSLIYNNNFNFIAVKSFSSYELKLSSDSPAVVGGNITYKGIITQNGKPQDGDYEISWTDSGQDEDPVVSFKH